MLSPIIIIPPRKKATGALQTFTMRLQTFLTKSMCTGFRRQKAYGFLERRQQKLDQKVDLFKRKSVETWFLLHNLVVKLVGKLPILLEVKLFLLHHPFDG